MRRPGAPRIETIVVPTPFPVGAVNVHLVLADPVTLVDTGPLTDEAWSVLVAGLRSHGLAPGGVKRVLLTHGHQDHFGLAGRLADAGATPWGAVADRRHFRMERQTGALLERLTRSGFGFASRFAMVASVAWVDSFSEPLVEWEPLHGGERLAGDGYRIEVTATPGHTPGSLTFGIPECRVAFTGDTVLAHITPNAIVDEDPDRPGETFRSLSHYMETLAGLEKGHATSRLKTGHGADIAQYRAHRAALAGRYRRRARDIARALKAGPRTVRDLVVELFPAVTHVNVYLAFSEVLGFLMYLEDLGEVERISTRSRDAWRLVGGANRRGQRPPGPAARCPSGPGPAPRPGAERTARLT